MLRYLPTVQTVRLNIPSFFSKTLSSKSQLFLGFLIVPSLFFMSSSAYATGLGARVSTLGVGVELTQSLHSNVNARIGINRLSLEMDSTYDGIDYKQSLNLSSVEALLDWHPFSGGFRVTGGLLLNDSYVDLESDQQVTFDIGNETYTTTDLSLKGRVSFQPVMPYIGIGWGMKPKKNRGWAVTAELGIVYMGEADVKLSATGSATNSAGTTFDVGSDAVFQENLVREEQALEDENNDFVVFPVLSLGVSFAF